jgi:outer membrane protein insertion porin family
VVPIPGAVPGPEPLPEGEVVVEEGAPAAEGPPPTVRSIRFEGNALFATESLKVLMRTKEGRLLDPALLDADMEALFRFFERVRVLEERSGTPPNEVVDLVFQVHENPLVVELQIFGAAEIPEEEIRGMLQTRVGYPLFPYAVASDAQDIVRAYREKGHHFANVPDPKVVTLPSGGRRVEFFVVEGPQVEVERIVFRGNVHVARKRLVEAMRTEEEEFIPFLSTATFREDTLLEDLVALRGVYRDHGFLDAEVVLDDLRFSDDKKKVTVVIAIVEHQRYCVGSVTVEIDRVPPGTPGAPPPEDIAFFTQDRLASMLGLVPGRTYSGECEREGREAILDAYSCRSYAEVVVEEAVLRPHEQALVVDVHLLVREGARYRLERLDFVGNEYTKDKVLRRESRLRPGGPLDRKELERTTKRLRSLGYFERVTLRLEDARARDGTPIPAAKTATYEVVEGSTASVKFGVQLSTDGGFGGSVDFTKRNFDIARPPRSFDELTSRRAWTGAGQTFRATFAPSTRAVQAGISFLEPHLFDTNFAFRASAERRFDFYEDYTVDRYAYSLGLSYPLYQRYDDTMILTAGGTWRHELIDIQDIEAEAVPGAFLFAGSNEIRSLSAYLSLGATDDLVKPDWAFRARLTGEVIGGALGGDIDVLKIGGSYEHDILVFEDDEENRHRLTGQFRFGYAHAFKDTPEVPPFERYYLGGRNLRGFEWRGVGPHVNGSPTGGEWMMAAGVEYEVPVVKDLLGAVAFVDSGTLSQSIHDPDAFWWRLSVGFGIRLKLPFLGSDQPLALDFGFPLLYEDEDERSLLTFSAGRTF